jgi:hypothetical protein
VRGAHAYFIHFTVLARQNQVRDDDERTAGALSVNSLSVIIL